MILTYVMSPNHYVYMSVNSQMWDECTFWANRCIRDIYTVGEAIMHLELLHVISPQSKQ